MELMIQHLVPQCWRKELHEGFSYERPNYVLKLNKEISKGGFSTLYLATLSNKQNKHSPRPTVSIETETDAKVQEDVDEVAVKVLRLDALIDRFLEDINWRRKYYYAYTKYKVKFVARDIKAKVMQQQRVWTHSEIFGTRIGDSSSKRKVKGSSLKSIKLEIEALQKLQGDPFVVAFIDSFPSPFILGNEYVLIFERVEAGDLDSILENSKLVPKIGNRRWFPPAFMRYLISPIFAAVRHLHSLGYIHRDLKPKNILLARDGVPKLCDFGACVYIGNHESLNFDVHDHVETRDFAAPEFFHSSTYDVRCDTWALGIGINGLILGGVYDQVWGGSLEELLKYTDEDIQDPIKAKALDDRFHQPGSKSIINYSYVHQTNGKEEVELVCDLLKKMLVIVPRYRSTISELCEESPWVRDSLEIWNTFLPRLKSKSINTSLDDCSLYSGFEHEQKGVGKEFVRMRHYALVIIDELITNESREELLWFNDEVHPLYKTLSNKPRYEEYMRKILAAANQTA